MSTFKAIQVFQKVSDFAAATKIIEKPLREPNDNEVRVKVVYAGINATDINLTANRYGRKLELPYGAGLEALGVVDAVGKEFAGTFKVGQPVLVPAGLHLDAFSEYLVSIW